MLGICSVIWESRFLGREQAILHTIRRHLRDPEGLLADLKAKAPQSLSWAETIVNLFSLAQKALRDIYRVVGKEICMFGK